MWAYSAYLTGIGCPGDVVRSSQRLEADLRVPSGWAGGFLAYASQMNSVGRTFLSDAFDFDFLLVNNKLKIVEQECPTHTIDLGRLPALHGFWVFRSCPGVLDPVNDCNRREHSDDPQHRRHAIEQRADDD